MKRFIYRHAWAFFLGGVLASAGWHAATWQFWAAMVPTVVLKGLSDSRAAR